MYNIHGFSNKLSSQNRLVKCNMNTMIRVTILQQPSAFKKTSKGLKHGSTRLAITNKTFIES